MQRDSERRSAAREQIKASIERGDIRVVCATDAACEGLNLQRLGAQVNVDLPWNPSRFSAAQGTGATDWPSARRYPRVESALRRTVEDDVYRALSDRFGDIFSVLGQLPDGFEDEWVNAVLRDRAAVRNFSQRVERARPPMELRYLRDVADDKGLDWEYTQLVARCHRRDFARQARREGFQLDDDILTVFDLAHLETGDFEAEIEPAEGEIPELLG